MGKTIPTSLYLPALTTRRSQRAPERIDQCTSSVFTPCIAINTHSSWSWSFHAQTLEAYEGIDFSLVPSNARVPTADWINDCGRMEIGIIHHHTCRGWTQRLVLKTAVTCWSIDPAVQLLGLFSTNSTQRTHCPCFCSMRINQRCSALLKQNSLHVMYYSGALHWSEGYVFELTST